MITLGDPRGAAVDDTVACLVKGPASRYPRGYVWLFPIWFVVLSAAVALVSIGLSGKLPLWLGVSEIGGLFLAGCIAAGVVLTSRRMAFWADRQGVLLGSRQARRRPKQRQVYLPWSHIAQVRVVPRRYGALVELLLSPAAPPVYRPSLGRQGSLLLGALFMPLGFGRGRPALTTMPRLRPPAYRIRICERADELAGALQALAPQTVQVRLLNSMAALRVASPRLPRAPRPPRAPSPPRAPRPRRFGEYVPRRLPTGARRP
jgi:hypothetical protein